MSEELHLLIQGTRRAIEAAGEADDWAEQLGALRAAEDWLQEMEMLVEWMEADELSKP